MNYSNIRELNSQYKSKGVPSEAEGKENRKEGEVPGMNSRRQYKKNKHRNGQRIKKIEFFKK